MPIFGRQHTTLEREIVMFRPMPRLFRKYVLLLVIPGIMLQIWLFHGGFPGIAPSSHSVSLLSPVKATNVEQRKQRPDFQTGMSFPQWGTTAYSPQDPKWQAGLQEIQKQTGAQWISLVINLTQTSPHATQVSIATNTPLLASMAAGIHSAHSMGYHVFVRPLISVQGRSPWAGSIHFTTEQEAQQWFDSYWQTFEPYIVASSRAGAEELAFGTEYALLERQWTPQWNQLIARVHAVFPGKLTYDMNWSSLQYAIPAWMHNPLLTSIGISEYAPLIGKPERLQPAAIPGLWSEKIGKVLDAFSVKLNKPVLITEIGYRDSPDALYNPWQNQTIAGTDPEEQAAAYDATLRYVISDPLIIGIFFWAWSFPPYAPNGKLASRVLLHWYTSPLA